MNIFTLIHIRLFPPPNFFSPYEAAKCEYPTYRHFVPHNGWAHGTISRVNCWVSDSSHQCALWLFGNNCNVLRKKKAAVKKASKKWSAVNAMTKDVGKAEQKSCKERSKRCGALEAMLLEAAAMWQRFGHTSGWTEKCSSGLKYIFDLKQL